MSMGYCGNAIFEIPDENTLMYLYCSYNLILEDYKEYMENIMGKSL